MEEEWKGTDQPWTDSANGRGRRRAMQANNHHWPLTTDH